MIRAVFDTNITLSGLLWTGAPAAAINAALDGEVRLLCSDALYLELETVFARPKLAKRLAQIGKTPETFLENYRKLVEFVQPAEITLSIRDPKDDMVIACAVGGKADCIVSGDDDLLSLGTINQIAIWDVHTFLAHLHPT